MQNAVKYNDWEQDLSAAEAALSQPKVIDIIQGHLLHGKVHTIEACDNETLLQMDIKAGIDYIREDDVGLQGIAARVQWGKAYNTFTIRKQRHTGTKTEMEKRIDAIKQGYMYPAFTLQAYFDSRENNKLISAGVMHTRQLYMMLLQQRDLFYERKSDNVFYVLPWANVDRHQIRIYEEATNE